MYLADFQIVKPSNPISQERILEWMGEVHVGSKERIEKICCKPKDIKQRLLVDASMLDQPDLGNFGHRAQKFHLVADKVFDELYVDQTLPPEHLIHVTCTGYRSPSAAQLQVVKRGWEKKTLVTHAYHMGCSAAMPAIRMGQGFASMSQGVVDVVHTEFCSLHLNPELNTDDQLIAESLFADGFIKYSITKGRPKRGFRILSMHEEMLPASSEAMKWECEAWGLKMTLSREIPGLVYRAITPFLERLEAKSECSLAGAHFAIHPGGPKIVDLIGRKMNLSEDQLKMSWKILKERGNISSATLPHIWEALLEDSTYKDGSLVVGIAFGPGLCISSILLEKVCT